MFAFLSQAVTGVFLAMYYQPDSVSRAYSSAAHITNDVFLGELVRGMHRWGSSVMIILIFLHIGRTSSSAPTRSARAELGDRGRAAGPDAHDGPHRLPVPVDQRSFWATVVAVNLNSSGP